MERFYHKQQMETPIHRKGNTMSQLKGFLSGLLLGSLAGAGAMLLLAPASGKRTRARIAHRYDEFRDQTVDNMMIAEEEVLTKAQHLASDTRGMVEELQHRGQAMFDGK
jgi:gas vesicle protein